MYALKGLLYRKTLVCMGIHNFLIFNPKHIHCGYSLEFLVKFSFFFSAEKKKKKKKKKKTILHGRVFVMIEKTWTNFGYG